MATLATPAGAAGIDARTLDDARLLLEARETSDTLHALIDAVEDYALCMLEPDGRVRTWNRGAERITGYAAAEVIGRHHSLFYPAADVEAGRPARNLQRAAHDGRVEDESFRVRKDGTPFFASTIVTPVLGATGQLAGFAAVMRDLTERRRAEETQRLLDGATVTLASTLDANAKLVDIARLVVREFADGCVVDVASESGELVRSAIALRDRELEAMVPAPSPDGARDAEIGPERAFATAQTQLYFEENERVSAGQPPRRNALARALRARSFVGAPIRAHARTLGVVTTLRGDGYHGFSAADVAFVEELARRAGLALENSRLYLEAQEAVAVRDEFLAIAAHELRTPLTPLRLQLETLQRALRRGVEPLEPLDVRLRRLIRQVDRLATLVESLLDVSRIGRGKLTLNVEELDFAELVADVVARFSEEATRAGSPIEVAAALGMYGRGDRLRLEQVVASLLSNALKYGSRSPIQVTAELYDRTLRLDVRDHGIGVEPEAMARIFERFERAVSVRHFGGLGLGLYISRQIVLAHGGTLSARSQRGEGSTFTLEIPWALPAHRVSRPSFTEAVL